MIPTASEPKARRLDDVVDELGLGFFQLVLILTGGSFFLFAGSLTTLFSLVNDAVAATFSAGTVAKGALLSVLFVGKLFGNLGSGFLSDIFGRRLPLLFALACGTAATIFSAFVYDLSFFLTWRFLIGIGFGFALPPWSALSGEMCPSTARIEICAAAMALFSFGSGYTMLLFIALDISEESPAWRPLTIGFALQGILCFGAIYFYTPESIRYLDRKASRDQVVAVLRRMRDMNGCPDLDIETWRSSEPAVDVGFAPIWCRSMLPTTITMCLTVFFANFSYYGQVYAFPQVLPDMELGLSMHMNLLLVSIVEIFGYVVAVWLSHKVTRKSAMMMYLIGVGLTTALFCIFEAAVRKPDIDGGAVEPGAVMNGFGDDGLSLFDKRPALAALIINIAVSAGRFCQSVGWTFCYVYVAEVYPTSCRACGMSVSAAFGRIGSIIAPMIFEGILAATGVPTDFFLLIFALAILNCALVAMLPVETADRKLGEIAAESQPLAAIARGRTS